MQPALNATHGRRTRARPELTTNRHYAHTAKKRAKVCGPTHGRQDKWKRPQRQRERHVTRDKKAKKEAMLAASLRIRASQHTGP